MHTESVTTPFGRRLMTLALVKGQLSIAESKAMKRADRWKVFRDISEARERLSLQDRALTVLNALLTFYPDNELDAERGLVVFPSNTQLSLRAHGMAGTTLRRHLAALIDAGLIQRRDSPNGKRYAHRDRDGEIQQAYGFDLTPLVARSAELAQLAQNVVAERIRFRRAKEELTICRRDVRKLISAAIEEGIGDNWDTIEATYAHILDQHPRYPTRLQVEATLEKMRLLRDEILNQLTTQVKTENLNGSAIQNGRHLQSSKPDSINELEPSDEKEQAENLQQEKERRGRVQDKKQNNITPIKAFPLGMVLRACPQISDYGPGGKIEHWRELMSAAVVVRSMLGVSPYAYEEACVTMGEENAAVAMACIFERLSMIISPGGYLRDLAKRSSHGEFSLGPMLMALLRAQGLKGRRAG